MVRGAVWEAVILHLLLMELVATCGTDKISAAYLVKLAVGHLSYTDLVDLLRDLGFYRKSWPGEQLQGERLKGLLTSTGGLSVEELVGEWKWSQHGETFQPPVPLSQVVPFHRAVGPLRAQDSAATSAQHDKKGDL